MATNEPGLPFTIAVWGGNLFGGAALGAAVNRALAPGSDWTLAVGGLALPLIFVIGLKMWYAALAGAMMNRLAGALWATIRSRGDFREEAQARFGDLRGKPMPGTGAFLLVALIVGPAAGLLTMLGPTESGAMTILLVWAAIGLVYGLFLRWLARSGRLPPPDPA